MSIQIKTNVDFCSKLALVRVLSLNLNGIRSAYHKGLINVMGNFQPDLICFQELKAHEQDIPKLTDHYAYWHCAEKKGYSGVGAVSKLPAKTVTRGIGNSTYDCEGRLIRLDFDNLSLLSVYVPSGSSKEVRQVFKMAFLNELYGYIKALLASKRELIICGDINIAHKQIDLRNWRQNQKSSGFLPEERAWFDRLLDLGLVDGFRHFMGPDKASYSWWSLRSGARARDVGWRLDYQLVTPKIASLIKHAEIIKEPIISDHAPVLIDYDLSLEIPSNVMS